MNAKREFVEHVKNIELASKIKCALMWVEEEWNEDIDKEMLLRVGHSVEDLSRFLDTLDFDYDNGFGSQELYGTIWYEDGTWSEREEYDGSEWWSWRKAPTLPLKIRAYKLNTAAKR